MTQTILIIDDEADIRNILADIFQDEGYNILKAAHSEQAFSIIQDHQIDLIVLDIWLDNSDMDGVQILKTLKKKLQTNNIPVLMISGHGNIEMAVNAMKLGAFDFIEKPFKIDHILLTVQRALDQKELRDENARLKNRDSATPSSANVAQYKSPVMTTLMKTIIENKASEARVLIRGAVGTGKTHIAKIIHTHSPRHHHGCLTVNGYRLFPSKLDEAIDKIKHGTLIIENIEGCTADTQSALLAKLTSKDNAPYCRFIATASDAIEDYLSDGRLSSALYDRLSVTAYDIPKLAQRREDIDDLITHFAKTTCDEFHCAPVALDNHMLNDLKARAWPGNIRHLKTAVELVVIEKLLNNDAHDMPQLPVDNVVAYAKAQGGNGYTGMPLKEAREQFERDYLEKIMIQFSGNIAKIADYIEMERTALYRKLKALGLSNNTTTNDEKAVS